MYANNRCIQKSAYALLDGHPDMGDHRSRPSFNLYPTARRVLNALRPTPTGSSARAFVYRPPIVYRHPLWTLIEIVRPKSPRSLRGVRTSVLANRVKRPSVGYAAIHAGDTPRIHCLRGSGRSSARRERFHPLRTHWMRRACAVAARTIPKRAVIPRRGCLRRGSGPA